MATVARLDERITKCVRILDENPNSQIFAALAEALRKKGELERAFRVCQNGLRIHPSYGPAHVVMAKINLDRGLYDWAEIEANKAMEIDGNTRSIRLLLAEIYIYKGEFQPAIKLLKKLSGSDPDNTQIRRLLDIACKLPEEQAAVSAAATPGVPQQDEQTEAKQPEPEQPSSLCENDVVRLSTEISGIEGALFLNYEGLIVESQWSLEMDPTACAATLGGIGQSVDQELVSSSFGSVRTVLIETDDPIFYVIRVDSGVFLFAADSTANLGTLRLKIESLLERYQQS